ncbi:MAG: glycyl-radical enzyme activating protein [Oscillospiraceae bacterium]|nr:glycyl-radical enzyme activating protein [Oscillospiraceae bacterium]
MDGFISQIQQYSTKDGPGVRSTVVAVGCPLNCLWCAYPELIGDAAKFLYHPRRCVACGACVAQAGGSSVDSEDGFEESSVICFYDAYEMVGEPISDKKLASDLLRDKVFYDQSGGGVTFSGGDPVLQAEFFFEVAMRLKDADVHVALDTSGHFPWEKLVPLVSACDLILFDLKFLSRVLHRRYTGVDNQLILENAMKIAYSGKPMIIRMILVPGVNDSYTEISGRLAFVKSLGSLVKLDIIKYKKLEVGKYASLEMIELMDGTEECSDEFAEHVLEMATSIGLNASIVS